MSIRSARSFLALIAATPRTSVVALGRIAGRCGGGRGRQVRDPPEHYRSSRGQTTVYTSRHILVLTEKLLHNPFGAKNSSVGVCLCPLSASQIGPKLPWQVTVCAPDVGRAGGVVHRLRLLSFKQPV